MSGWLLDTNVVSELRKRERGNVGVRSWIDSAAEENLFLSALTLGEIRKGVELLRARDPIQATLLEQWLNNLKKEFDSHLLQIDSEIAEKWGRLQAIRPLPIVDALIAATCLRHDLTLVTRNNADFRDLGVSLLNPFSET
jgi:predicted nucleic acid-binding protein